LVSVYPERTFQVWIVGSSTHGRVKSKTK